MEIIKLVYTVQEIKFLNEYFKQNSSFLSKEDFLKGVSSLLKRSPAMFRSFSSCYDSGKNLQPGYLTEINICATLAKLYQLDYVENITELNLRHLYSNEFYTLKEYGNCDASDIYLTNSQGKTITIEVKEPLSLGGDFDLCITEEGKLYPKLAAGRIFPEAAQKILDSFNENDNIFNHLGHNIPLTNSDYLENIMNSYLNNKQIDYIATYSKDNGLIYFPANELIKHVDFKGSEIRSAGKNKVKVYTPKAFREAMNSVDCILIKDTVAIPKDKVEYRYARGSNGRISGIKINSIFYFEMKDIFKEDELYYYTKISSGKQLKQSISVHLNIK